MNKNNLEFDVVSVDQRNLESFIVFQIQQISSIVQRISVGQFIKSSPFELNFPISIGKSTWNLILFPNGQYEAGQANDLITIYLKLVQCEHQSTEFKFDVTFQFGSESGTIDQKNQHLCFANVKTRWLGAKIIKITEMIRDQSQFIRDDVLMLTITLNEHVKERPPPSPELFSDNSYSYLSESFDISDDKNIGPPVESNKSMFRDEPYARHLHLPKLSSTPTARNSIQPADYNTWHDTPSSKSHNATALAYGTGQAYRENIIGSRSFNHIEFANSPAFGTGSAYRGDIIRDNNLNYVDHEFSDDEDKKPTESKKESGGFLANLKFFFGNSK